MVPDYEGLGSAHLLARFHEQLSVAERMGAVELRRGKRERSHLIDRVLVKDPQKLAEHLGRAPASLVADQAKHALMPIASSGETWVLSVLEEITARWSRGEAAFRLLPGELDVAQEFITLLASISKDQARGLDARSFSLRATGDTKAFDRHAGRLAAVLVNYYGEPGVDASDLWIRIGLERFSHPVHVRGCIVAEDENGVLVDGRASPFASFHPEMLPLVRLKSQPVAVVTIENYASFNRYVREIDDDALVVYTGGFASTGAVALLKLILTMLPPTVPFFHWGDIDPGGLRIFRFLEERLPRAPKPHLMCRSLAERMGRPAARDPSLSSISKTDSALASLAAWLACGEQIKHLEQEALDPISPMKNRLEASFVP